MNIDILIKKLRQWYPVGAFPGGQHGTVDPFRVLIATILSQRTRDENTRKATEQLFSVYKNAEELAYAKEEKIGELIRSSGFYKVKARGIKEVARIICENYDKKVPDNMEVLLTLPLVGRKTANCVLAYGYGKPSIPVDTHVHRISNRLGLVDTKTPEQTEKVLMEVVPRKYWLDLNELFVRFGQDICKPIKPKCEECIVRTLCPK